MDSQEELYRILRRRPFEECGPLIGSLWDGRPKAERLKNYDDDEYMDKLLAPAGWTSKEYKAETEIRNKKYFIRNP